jgi:hypothetical protein
MTRIALASLVLAACSSTRATTPGDGAADAATDAATVDAAPETIGGGSLADPAVGPPASFGLGSGFTLVKNWNFGASGTIRDIADLSANFAYHDQFGTIGNGSNYGALMVAPDAASAVTDAIHGPQPVVNGTTVPEVRAFTADSLQTFLVPLDGATTIDPTQYDVGCGSFVASFHLPNGGALLGQDVLWETRVRYVTPPYFWFAIWAAGNMWNHGAEEDVIESFGFDNGGGYTNYAGAYWHSNSVGGTDQDAYADWGTSMSSHGVTGYDATQYHVWSWLYRKDDTYAVYVDGIEVQTGTLHWTYGAGSNGEPIDMTFLFDAGWGHTQVASVNHSLPASSLAGTLYEWDYSRIYLRP